MHVGVSCVVCVWTNQEKLWTARCTMLGGSHLLAGAWSTQQSERSAAGPICSTTGRAVWVLPSIYTPPIYSLSLVQPFITLPLIPHCVVFLSQHFVHPSSLSEINTGHKPSNLDLTIVRLIVTLHVIMKPNCGADVFSSLLCLFSNRGHHTVYNHYHGRVPTVVVQQAKCAILSLIHARKIFPSLCYSAGKRPNR